MFLFLELRFLSFGIEFEDGQVKNKLVFIAMSITEKAQWIADIAQVRWSAKIVTQVEISIAKITS